MTRFNRLGPGLVREMELFAAMPIVLWLLQLSLILILMLPAAYDRYPT